MIRVEREPEPEILRRKSAAWAAELCAERLAYYRALERYEQGVIKVRPKVPRAVKEHYGHDGVKSCLASMFGSKCCYCEGSIEGISYLHVEHYHPQSIYPGLAYCWTNLLFACEQCNCTYKKDRFPLSPDEVQAQPNTAAPCAMDNSDSALLVDPCRDDPAEFFDYEFVAVEPGKTDVILVCSNRRAEITRDVCGLDRDGLNDARRKHLSHAVTAAVNLYKVADQQGNEEYKAVAAANLRYFISPSAPFSAMAFAYVALELPEFVGHGTPLEPA